VAQDDGDDFGDLTDFIRDLPKTEGMPVLACLPGSAAAAGGIVPGDVVLEVNGVPIDGVRSYINARRLDRDTMAILLRRNGEEQRLTIQLASSDKPRVNARGSFIS
jgi:S1-C subfamily serine protease